MHREAAGSMKSLVRPLAQDALLQDRLDSWKAIASYLNRDVRTVQRWEKEEGLPVRRHPHIKASSVYGLKTEIDEWRKTCSLAATWATESEATSHDTAGQLDRLILSLSAEIIGAQKESRSCKDEPCPVLVLHCFPSKFVFLVSLSLASAYDSSESVPSALEGDKSRCYFALGGEQGAI